jgi:IclR family KDG regulon transcriptional repressor
MYSAPLLKKAIEVIKLVAEQNRPLGVTEISKTLSISKSTVFGILRALEEEGFIYKDPAIKKYSVGQQLLELSLQVFHGVELTAVAKPHLEKLVSLVDESVFLGIREENRVKVLDAMEPRKSFKITSPIGTKFPITASVLGKVFLSPLPDEEIRTLLKKIGLPRYTENSIIDIDAFLEEVARTREAGYGVDVEEYLKGIRAIATLIRAKETPVAAIWIVGFAHSMSDEKLPQMVRHLRNTERIISERVAHLKADKTDTQKSLE